MNYLFMALFAGLRPLLGPAHCYYTPSCGRYALKQLEEKPILHALFAIAKRVVSCNPWLHNR